MFHCAKCKIFYSFTFQKSRQQANERLKIHLFGTSTGKHVGESIMTVYERGVVHIKNVEVHHFVKNV